MGHKLQSLKDELPHGEFGDALKAEGLPFSERTAQRWMAAARAFGSNTAAVSELPKRQLYQLATLKHEGFRNDLLNRRKGGDVVSVSEMKKEIQAAVKAERAGTGMVEKGDEP